MLKRSYCISKQLKLFASKIFDTWCVRRDNRVLTAVKLVDRIDTSLDVSLRTGRRPNSSETHFFSFHYYKTNFASSHILHEIVITSDMWYSRSATYLLSFIDFVTILLLIDMLLPNRVWHTFSDENKIPKNNDCKQFYILIQNEVDVRSIFATTHILAFLFSMRQLNK